jgi:hypothetical protein
MTIAGLLLDIGGAGMLAIPDIHRARIQFVFGRLKEAMEEVEYGKLQRDDIGFQDVARRYVKEYGAGERGTENIEYITQEPKASPDLDSTDSAETRATRRRAIPIWCS